MAKHDFRMPDIGEGIVDAEVVKWHVSIGDHVAEDAPVADVMTDKATVEITSPVAGTVLTLGCEPGERIAIGKTLVQFDTARVAAAASDAAETARLAQATSAAADTPAADSAADGVTDSPTPPGKVVPAEQIRQVKVPGSSLPGDTGRGGGETDRTAAARGRALTPAVSGHGRRLNTPRTEDKPHIRMRAEAEGGPRRQRVLASPAVRRRARELGIELAQVFGTGPDGRVMRADLEAGAAERDSRQGGAQLPPARDTDGPAPAVPAQRDDSVGAAEEQPLIGLRRIIAARLAESSRAIPHFTYVEEVDVTELEALRQYLNGQRDASLPRISLLHFVLLGVCRAVAGWPQCNAHFDDERHVLLRHTAVHLGIATMTDEGLLVPVIRDADSLDLDAMAAAVADLAARARAKRLPRERLSGSTLTVTSLGALAGIATTPIINRPETTIIGPNRMSGRLVMQNGQLIERRVMNISSSFDHRVVDGHDAASFIGELKSLLEHPASLFL